MGLSGKQCVYLIRFKRRPCPGLSYWVLHSTPATPTLRHSLAEPPLYALHMTMRRSRGPRRSIAHCPYLSRPSRWRWGRGRPRFVGGVKWCRVVPVKSDFSTCASTSDQHQHPQKQQLWSLGSGVRNQHGHQKQPDSPTSGKLANDLITIPRTSWRL